MKKNKDDTSDIYEEIDRFICYGMDSFEETKFLDRVYKGTEMHDKMILSFLMIKAILNKGIKNDSELLNVILYGHKDD